MPELTRMQELADKLSAHIDKRPELSDAEILRGSPELKDWLRDFSEILAEVQAESKKAVRV